MILQLIILVVKIILLIGLLMGGFAYTMLLERRLLGFFQLRLGPNRVGPFGLMQPLADGLKMAMKEDLMPNGADKWVFRMAPVFSLFAALSVDAVIPFGAPIHLFGTTISLDIANPSIGLLIAFAFSSLGIYGIVLGGWASQNKYSLLGGIRASAQMISYELAMGLSVLGVLMLAGTANLEGIVLAQKEHGWFFIPEFIPFLIYYTTAIAETNRTPFDLPEAESELVAGYHTEYSGFRFAMFYIAEYINMIAVSGIAVTLFFGGWLGPSFLPPIIWFLLKVGVSIFIFIWIRATFPRFRYDKLMSFGWKFLVPVSFVYFLATAAFVSGVI
ncbi:NADH-quinone oxidoreductase subunit NuoH [Sulfobacillus thermosulfidooxidans]|uniref:NADH-quinone oxidoreductase subunit NuoH n=1 Tax=Sulfobacillus thermosulfidooxidans TaxID=28034 RepID=UPI0006B508EC|nr:NADH-quinone oxidoreductase subunit NuoH [Sulfobacillus thermosulfidooxidans]